MSAPSRVHPLLAMVLLVSSSGCGERVPTMDRPGASRPAPDCEREGYPCRLQDVDPAVFWRSDTLALAILDQLEEGQGVARVLDWIRGQDGIIDASAEDEALLFRLEGGRPTLVFLDVAGVGEGDAEPASRTRSAPGNGAPSGAPRPAAAPASAAWFAPDIVGDDPEDKRALVLSPYAWQFGALDDGPVVAKILSATRGYDGNVEFYMNPESSTDDEVTWSHFTGWGDYDVIHLSTHGLQLCRPGFCRTFIMTGINLGFADFPAPGGAGAGYWLKKKSVGPREIHREYYLANDFFRLNYAGGLDDTIVFFSACQTTRGPEMYEAAGGTGGVFLGWTESVYSSVASSSSEAFYVQLSKRGIRTETAYDDMTALGMGLDSHHQARLTRHQGGQDLRIREVVWALEPTDGHELEPGDSVEVVGARGDGKLEKLPFRIRVDGVEDDPVEDFVVHYVVNGVEAHRSWPLSEGRQENAFTWVLEDTMQLWFDLSEMSVVDVEAWVELPEGGESRHEVERVHLVEADAWVLSVGGGARAGTYRGMTAHAWHMAPDDHELRVTVRSEPDAERFVLWEVHADGQISEPGTYPLRLGCSSNMIFVRLDTPPGQYRDYDSMCSGDGTPSGTGVDYPAPSTLTIARITDDWIEGSVTGTFFSQGGQWQRPELTAPVSVRFRARRCGVWGRNDCPDPS